MPGFRKTLRTVAEQLKDGSDTRSDDAYETFHHEWQAPSDDNIYELPVINVMGGQDIWNEREE